MVGYACPAAAPWPPRRALDDAAGGSGRKRSAVSFRRGAAGPREKAGAASRGRNESHAYRTRKRCASHFFPKRPPRGGLWACGARGRGFGRGGPARGNVAGRARGVRRPCRRLGLRLGKRRRTGKRMRRRTGEGERRRAGACRPGSPPVRRRTGGATGPHGGPQARSGAAARPGSVRPAQPAPLAAADARDIPSCSGPSAPRSRPAPIGHDHVPLPRVAPRPARPLGLPDSLGLPGPPPGPRNLREGPHCANRPPLSGSGSPVLPGARSPGTRKRRSLRGAAFAQGPAAPAKRARTRKMRMTPCAQARLVNRISIFCPIISGETKTSAHCAGHFGTETAFCEMDAARKRCSAGLGTRICNPAHGPRRVRLNPGEQA